MQITTITNYDPPSVLKGSFFFNALGYRWRLRVSLSRITHISAAFNGTTIHTLSTKYETPYQLGDLAHHLLPDRFYRIHPLHIVALEHIKEIDKKEVLVNGFRLFSTHLYRSRLLEALERKTSGADFICDGKVIRIAFAGITHAGLVGNDMIIYTTTCEYRTAYDMNEILNRLPEGRFVRISRTFLVAPAYIDSIENDTINIGHHQLTISLFYRTKLLPALQFVEPKPIVQITN